MYIVSHNAHLAHPLTAMPTRGAHPSTGRVEVVFLGFFPRSFFRGSPLIPPCESLVCVCVCCRIEVIGTFAVTCALVMGAEAIFIGYITVRTPPG